ncbi:MAG: hypothetical protein JJU21_17540 [Salinarimonas sp.]|nr:hypothetical protein [Salinarimonas sp.]
MSRTKATNLRATVTVVSALIFVATQVLGVSIAAGWAIAGLFELGNTIGYILMVLFSGFGLYMLWAFWKQATTAEPLNKPD